jgi:hypothetical protein
LIHELGFGVYAILYQTQQKKLKLVFTFIFYAVVLCLEFTVVFALNETEEE